MKTTKIIIGSAVLIGTAGVAYLLMKKRSGATPSSSGNTTPPVDTYADEPWFGLLPAGNSSPPAAPARVGKYPEGTLLREGNSDAVFLIDAAGYRHWIRNRLAFDRMGLKMTDVKSISNSEMQAIPRLEDLSGLNGVIF